MLAASVHGGNKRGCWLHAWVRAARVGAGCKRRCWLQAWVLAASVGAGGKHVMVAASVGAGCTRGASRCAAVRIQAPVLHARGGVRAVHAVEVAVILKAIVCWSQTN